MTKACKCCLFHYWSATWLGFILDAMGPFSEGIHRALVPVESQMDHVAGVELAESSPGYRILTQMDIVQFLKLHGDEIKSISTSSVGQLGSVKKSIFAVPANMQVADAVKCMRNASLTAVAIIEASPPIEEGPMLITEGRVDYDELAKNLIGECPLEIMDFALSMFGNDIAIAFNGVEDVVLIEYARLMGRPFRIFNLDIERRHPET
eukprot:Gb_14240 [translate_table: standard]